VNGHLFIVIGEVTGDHQFTFYNPVSGDKPIDLQLADFFGKPPRTVMTDSPVKSPAPELEYDPSASAAYLDAVLQLKRWHARTG
jgi:phosphoribosylformylglycinamidine synthase